MESGFIDDPKLADEEVKIPYYCIVLTPEQTEMVKNSKPDFYTTDGKIIFLVKKDGVVIGSTLFVMFK